MYMQFIALHQCIVNNLQLMAEWTNSHSVSARVQGILKDDTVEPPADDPGSCSRESYVNAVKIYFRLVAALLSRSRNYCVHK